VPQGGLCPPSPPERGYRPSHTLPNPPRPGGLGGLGRAYPFPPLPPWSGAKAGAGGALRAHRGGLRPVSISGVAGLRPSPASRRRGGWVCPHLHSSMSACRGLFASTFRHDERRACRIGRHRLRDAPLECKNPSTMRIFAFPYSGVPRCTTCIYGTPSKKRQVCA
jgi:hypothetical protein